MNNENFKRIVAESVSKSEVCRKMGFPENGTGLRKVRTLIKTLEISTEHFSHQAAMNKFHRRYQLINKTCPVCGNIFQAKLNHPKEQVTCSHGCSNTWFRARRNKKERYGYRRRAIEKWGKKCLVCGYFRFVDVHHIDGNHKNNNDDNLIPLCGNHHQEIHNKQYYQEIENIILEKYKLKTNPPFEKQDVA